MRQSSYAEWKEEEEEEKEDYSLPSCGALEATADQTPGGHHGPQTDHVCLPTTWGCCSSSRSAWSLSSSYGLLPTFYPWHCGWEAEKWKTHELRVQLGSLETNKYASKSKLSDYAINAKNLCKNSNIHPPPSKVIKTYRSWTLLSFSWPSRLQGPHLTKLQHRPSLGRRCISHLQAVPTGTWHFIAKTE